MTFPAWIAAIVFFMQLPVPLYWLVLHPAKSFWRKRRNAAFVFALLLSWLPVTVLLVIFHRELLRNVSPSRWQMALGFLLIALEVWMFSRVRRDLGGARLVGATELSGGGEIARSGIYARIRHPRYTGSFLAILGACLLAATPAMWMTAAVWTLLMRTSIALEEQELRGRFGDSYLDYCRRVPGFIPRLFPHRQQKLAGR